ncbi:P-type conjugative transfer protein TrbJ [Sphingomonas colocasiae]|uniref:P-type conjugative transfer protein TrbJ n=2 Tax=Sphingomonas colocasiae TaxID=1848973 RepID=A0ABS7PPF1_9SPHN|nr:P-type conjugative transfer protein TrbJ [Sphingomonas colocasiae]
MPRRPRSVLIAAFLGTGVIASLAMIVLPPPTPAQAQLAVFDPTNYAQNILTAARTLQQVNQQIQQLQNEASMLINMGKHLAKIDFPQLDALRRTLGEIDKLMGQARGIDFRVDQLDDRLGSLFPRAFEQALNSDQRVQAARARLDASTEAFRKTMTVQSQVVENVHEDASALAEIIAKSQGAEGSLQAQQATNQLLALTAKQQFQLQQMMAAQFRSEAVEQQRRLTQSEEARAATKRFLGNRKAYTPER